MRFYFYKGKPFPLDLPFPQHTSTPNLEKYHFIKMADGKWPNKFFPVIWNQPLQLNKKKVSFFFLTKEKKRKEGISKSVGLHKQIVVVFV